jgi:hypothetical protein
MPNDAMKPPLHSKPYNVLVTLLIILGTLGIAIAFIYLS